MKLMTLGWVSIQVDWTGSGEGRATPCLDKFQDRGAGTQEEYPGGLLRLDPAFAYAEPPSS